MGLIPDIAEIEKALSDKVRQFSEELSVPPTCIFVKMYQDQNSGQIAYDLYNKAGGKDILVKQLDVVKDILPIKPVMGKKIDFFGHEQMLNAILNMKLNAYTTKYKCDGSEISALVMPRSNDDLDVVFALYQGKEFKEWIDVSGGDE